MPFESVQLPKSDNQKYEKPIYGGAQVTAIEGNKVRITYLPKTDYYTKVQTEVKFHDGQITKIFDADKLPIKFEPGFDEVLLVTSREDGEISFSPYNYSFKCRFAGFGRPNGENTPPIWKESKPKNGKNRKTGADEPYTTKDFQAYFVIDSNPMFKGTKLVMFLQYLFVKNEATGNAGLGFVLISPSRAKQSKAGQKLLDMLGACGVRGADIQWPEDGNILPQLEALMLKENRQVRITLQDGWVTGIEPVSRIADDFEEVPVMPKEVAKHFVNPDEM